MVSRYINSLEKYFYASTETQHISFKIYAQP